jgi:hypothetical protein
MAWRAEYPAQRRANSGREKLEADELFVLVNRGWRKYRRGLFGYACISC